MILAELHGNVPEGVSGSEDILTSSVFGVLETLPSERLLLPWLRRATRLDGSHPLLPPEAQAFFRFWPSITARALNRVEPDVIVTLREPSGAVTVMLVEAKFRSGPSGWPTGPETEKVTGQLGQEWLALCGLPPREAPGNPPRIGRRILLYITADLVRPRELMLQMSREVAKARSDPDLFRRNLYWLGWRDLSIVIDQERLEDTAVRRLRELLDQRRLSVFAGCAPPLDTLALAWVYRVHETYLITGPEISQLGWTYRGHENYPVAHPGVVALSWFYPEGDR